MEASRMTPDQAKLALTERRTELTRHLAEIEDRLDDPSPKDWEDAATEAEDDQMLESLGAVERAEVARIDAALARIEDGAYGECVTCGEPIAEKRLAILPETPHCARCAA
jgi:RNA polymerase-binding transcription factor DksA